MERITVDITGPMVSFNLDSQRINAVLGVVISAVNKLTDGLDTARLDIQRITAAQTKTASDLNALVQTIERYRLPQIVDRLGTVEGAVEAHDGAIRNLLARHETFDTRLKAEEARVIPDVAPILTELSIHKQDIKTLSSSINNIQQDSLTTMKKLDRVESSAAETNTLVTTLYTLFEIPTSEAARRAERRSSMPASTYILSLPAFKALKNSFTEGVGELEKNLNALSGDLKNVRGLAMGKADKEEHAVLKNEVGSHSRTIQTLLKRVEDLADLLRLQNVVEDIKEQLKSMSTTKADRAELMGMVTQADLSRLHMDMAAMGDTMKTILIDSQSRTSERRSSKSAVPSINLPPAAANTSPHQVTAPSTQITKELLERMRMAEEGILRLDDKKANREDLNMAYQYMDQVVKQLQLQVDKVGPSAGGVTENQTGGSLPPLRRPPSGMDTSTCGGASDAPNAGDPLSPVPMPSQVAPEAERNITSGKRRSSAKGQGPSSRPGSGSSGSVSMGIIPRPAVPPSPGVCSIPLSAFSNTTFSGGQHRHVRL